jgi:hypothetical protein
MHERYVFVGVNRSPTAQEKGYSWQECQRTGVPVLSAIKLFDALSFNGLDPKVQIFFNLWNDDRNLNELVLEELKKIAEDEMIIVGMGAKVQAKLEELGIPHLKLIHPAARGIFTSKALYREHIKEVLTD